MLIFSLIVPPSESTQDIAAPSRSASGVTDIEEIIGTESSSLAFTSMKVNRSSDTEGLFMLRDISKSKPKQSAQTLQVCAAEFTVQLYIIGSPMQVGKRRGVCERTPKKHERQL